MVREITARELSDRLAAGEATLIIDVRQPDEFALARLPGGVLVPLGELAVRASEIDPDPGTLVVTVCHHGVRSYKAAAYLAHVGVPDVASLAGGIDAWSVHVDPGVPRY